MVCKNCGQELSDDATICFFCGVPTENFDKQEKVDKSKEKTVNAMAIVGFIFSFLVPILGWIFGGIGLKKAEKEEGVGRKLSIIAIVISSINFAVNLIIGVTLTIMRLF